MQNGNWKYTRVRARFGIAHGDERRKVSERLICFRPKLLFQSIEREREGGRENLASASRKNARENRSASESN